MDANCCEHKAELWYTTHDKKKIPPEQNEPICGKKHCWLWVIPLILLIIAIIIVCIIEFSGGDNSNIDDEELDVT